MWNTEKKKRNRMDYLEEGRKMRVAQADEILKLETIKHQKLNYLQNMGINNKYMADLERKKIVF